MTNDELIKIAKKYLGKGGALFRSFCRLGSGQPWCNAFVDYIYYSGGVASLIFNGKRYTYCPDSIAWCNKNLAQIPIYLAMASDLIFFDWERNGRPNHIGLVVSKIDTNKIRTIEGNTSGGRVAEKTRVATYVQGVYRPHFKPTGMVRKKLSVDGECGYNTIFMLQIALKITADGILGKETVKALQRKSGASADGSWGTKTSKAVQKMIGTKADGEFGINSVKALQTWINKNTGSGEAEKPVEKPVEDPVTKKYTGTFPDLVKHSGQVIGYTAKDLAYSKGTKKSTYTYPKGKAKEAFRKAIKQVYPNRNKWSKQCQAGASCDVGAGTIIRYSGYDPKIPRGLSEQIPHLQKSNKWKKTGLTKASQMSAGDVGIYKAKSDGHIWIGVGGKLIAEANHTAKYFEHIDTDNYTSSNKKTWGIYRACKPMPIRRGDRGTEVNLLQSFLNWYGNYKLDVDGIYGEKTEKAVKDFQTKSGIRADGEFGAESLSKAKEAEK